MARFTWNEIALIAGAAFVGTTISGYCFSFSPGWANFGSKIYVVFAGGLALISFLSVFMLSATVGAAIGSLCSQSSRIQPRECWLYTGWLVISAMVAIAAARLAFLYFHNAALEAWPKGYNP